MKAIIQTERLLIREIEENDISHLLSIYQDSRNMEFIPNSNIKWSEKELREKYRKTNKEYKNGYGIYAVELKNSNLIIGEAGLFNSFQSTDQLELGYILDNKHWKKNYGSEICNSLINYGFEKLRLHKLIARMFSENIASIKLSEKCGMKLKKQGVSGKGEQFSEYEIENYKL